MILKKLNSLFVLFVILSCNGCGYDKAITPAEPRGFIERKDDNLVSDKLPFQYVWRSSEQSEKLREIREQGSYKLYVEPISTELLEYQGKDESLDERVAEISQYLRERIIAEVNSSEGQFVTAHVVDSKDAADIALEIALVEIGLGSPLLYTGAWAAPVPGVATAVDSMHQPLLAIESRLVDLESNKPISEMADRKIPKIRPLDLNKATSRMSPLRDICNTWAKEIARAVQTRLDKEEVVKGDGAFTLLPW